MTTKKYLIKSDNKYITNQAGSYKLTKNINFAYVYDNLKEIEDITKFMDIEEYEIIEY